MLARKILSKLAPSQFSVDAYGELIVRPVALMPYFISFGGVLPGVLLVALVFTARDTYTLFVSGLAALLVLGGVLGVLASRLSGFPRLRIRGHSLVLEQYFGKPKVLDMSGLGRAFPVTVQHRTYIAFASLEEEHAFHMLGRRDEIDMFNTSQFVDVTEMVDTFRQAGLIARAIERHRSRPVRPDLDYDEIREIVRRATSRRPWLIIAFVVICVFAALLKSYGS